jgi:hypothetical protein
MSLLLPIRIISENEGENNNNHFPIPAQLRFCKNLDYSSKFLLAFYEQRIIPAGHAVTIKPHNFI